MSPLLLHFLRRIALVALLLAAAVAFGPRILTELGLSGPEVEDVIAGAEHAVEAARIYGATEDLSRFAAAERELESARALAQRGRKREARQAARRASEQAILAQRDALLRRDAQRRQAQAVVEEADRRLNDLEKIYTQVTKGLEKRKVAELLSSMKEARQAGAGLVLAFEQDDYPKVLADQAAAFATLDVVLAELRKAGSRG
jgi:hypothetical protein